MTALSLTERTELRDAARALLSRASPSERVRATIESSDSHDPDLWRQVVALGWPSIHVDEEHGGGGCGFGDVAVVLHELGRALAPSPFLGSAVLATSALAAADNRALAGPLLASLAAGERIGSVAFASIDGSYEPELLTTSWEAQGSAMRLVGSAGFVLDADLADDLVVAARGDDGTCAVVVVPNDAPGLTIERAPTVDETRRLFRASFDGVAVGSDHALCEPGADALALLDGVLAVAVVAAALDAVGAAEVAMEVAAEYATERKQFGKPIGTFQAVKHHCANMAIAIEASSAAAHAAAVELDAPGTVAALTAAVTASYVGPACSEVCGLAMRVHGGIGFTWAHDVHLRMKRVKLDELLFGTPSWHRRRLADLAFTKEAVR